MLIDMYIFQVAGVIAASGNNGHGITGVAWSGINLIGCKLAVHETATKAFGKDVVKCLDFCMRMKAKITTNSFQFGPNKESVGIPFNHMMYEKFIEFGKYGGLSFMGAGNLNENMLGFDFQSFSATTYTSEVAFPGPQPAGYAQTPSGLKSMINVAAMCKEETDNIYEIRPCPYSGVGAPYVDLFAPGGNPFAEYDDAMLTLLATRGSTLDKKNQNGFSDGIKTNTKAWDNAYYMLDSGTSFASPHAAGAAALVWAEYPQLTNDQVKEILCSTASNSGIFAVDFMNGTEVPYSTYGVLNVAEAIAKARRFKLDGAIIAWSPPPPPGANLITG
jgi:hypothetical protein